MKIHALNYEAYAIDFLEGNLSPSESQEFETFLAENPQIKKEISGLQLFHAEPIEKMQFPHKKDLMKPVASSKASMFRLPSWAVAACWALVVASMVFWLWGPSENTPDIALDATQWEEDLDPSDKQIEIVRVDVSHLKKTSTSSVQEEKNAAPNIIPEPDNTYEQEAYAENTERTPLQYTGEKLQRTDRLEMLPLQVELQDMQVYAETPETIYYRPLKKLKLDPVQEELQPQSERESKIALMTPLKKVMRPEDYKRINEFSLMDDVINEIDGREIADAFTPEFLKNNLK